jgi:hypothetical protein
MNWELVSTGPQPYIFGDADQEEEIKSVIGVLEYDPSIAVESVAQKGNLKHLRSTYNNFSLGVMNPNQSLFPGRLNWTGDSGLFETRWKIWAQFWAQRTEVSAEFRFSVNQLIYVSENITSKFSTKEGEFIIEEMETVFGLNGIGNTRVKGWKI